MPTSIYTQNESTGALKLIADIDGIDDGPLAVDALLDEMPRLKDREFVTVVGTIDDGIVSRVIVEDEDAPIVQPRRRMRNTRSTDEEAAPAPKRRQTRKPAGTAAKAPAAKKTTTRKTSTAKKPAAKKPAAKTAAAKKTTTAKKPAAKKPAAKSPVSSRGRGTAASASAKAKSSPFGRNAASDE